MRRKLAWLVAALELAAAAVTLVFAWRLPGGGDVERTVGRVEAVSRGAGKQVRGLAGQVRQVRRRQPELARLAVRLERQMRTVSADVKARSFDAAGLTTVSDALGQVAEGLDGLSQTLAPASVTQLGKGLSGTADYLDQKVLPAAEKAAAGLDRASKGLKGDAGKLSAAFKEAPVELRSARAMVESLSRFEEGLEQMARLAKMENFEAMRQGFTGLETSLDGGAEQVEKVAKYTIPKVEVKGLKVIVEEKDFWPDGKAIAEGMRKGATGCRAAGKEMDAINKELPKLRASLAESRKVVRTTRQALATALAQQEKLEPVLRRLPRHLALLADELPRLIDELTRVLRETENLKEVARALRQAEKSMAQASANWPKLRAGLGQSATILRATQRQARATLAHRDRYERTLRETVELTALFAESLPLLLGEVDAGLERQEASLDELGDGIDRVSETLPEVAGSAASLLTTTRTMLGLFALALALHAVMLWGGALERPGPA